MKKLLFLLLITTSLYSEQISSLSEGLVALWHFNEGSGATIIDSVGKTKGTLIGGLDTTGWVTGKYSYGLKFDGINDNVNCGNILQMGDVAFSFSLWVKSTKTSTIAQVVITQSIDSDWWFGDSNANNSTWGLWCPETGWLPNTSPTLVVPLNKWVHLVFTYNGGTVAKFYMDGVLINTSNAVGGIISHGTFLMGTRSSTLWYAGFLDEVGFWNRTLSAGEIKKLYLSQRKTFNVE